MMRSQWLTVVVGLLSLAPPAWARSVATSYTYNADGALAAASVATDGGPARQSYFVWDNFTHAASAPASGVVRAGNGNPTIPAACWRRRP